MPSWPSKPEFKGLQRRLCLHLLPQVRPPRFSKLTRLPGVPVLTRLLASEHLKKVHLNSTASGIACISQSDLDQVRTVTAKNRKAHVRDKYDAIRRALPSNNQDDDAASVYIPTMDEARSMAAEASKKSPGTEDIFAIFKKLCQKETSWFSHMSDEEQDQQLVRACQMFPAFIRALGVHGAFPDFRREQNTVPSKEKPEESKQDDWETHSEPAQHQFMDAMPASDCPYPSTDQIIGESGAGFPLSDLNLYFSHTVSFSELFPKAGTANHQELPQLWEC
ncbi:hypothetical protein MKZ38_009356 [Zalerion maritima]|uniref:Uncharacterized protein n=1 Tax=Zalerion maritima TaxID=339359 RepID=A0AAD5S1Q8_9PEZI|nr:hypothetical protein MKZ38_009356 [Zalerion maritima]